MRLIDADDLINEIIEAKQEYIGTHNDVVLHDLMCDNAIAWADGAETIDAVPVVHGWWYRAWCNDHESKTDWICSECEGEIYNTEKTNFCPHCGAKMDGET